MPKVDFERVCTGGRTQNWGRPCRRLLNWICWLAIRVAMRWQLLLVATCQRCDCNLCRLAAPLVMQRFVPACQPAGLCASHPKSIIRQRGLQNRNRQRTKKLKKGKRRMKPKTKRAKCVMRYFLLIFSSSLLLVCGSLCVCARVSMSGCFRVRVKCAEWHIVFHSVGSADRWKHLMLAICICHLTPRQPTRRQRAQNPPRCLTTNTCDAFYWNYQWGQRSRHSPTSCVKSLLTVLQVADVVEKDFL